MFQRSAGQLALQSRRSKSVGIRMSYVDVGGGDGNDRECRWLVVLILDRQIMQFGIL